MALRQQCHPTGTGKGYNTTLWVVLWTTNVSTARYDDDSLHSDGNDQEHVQYQSFQYYSGCAVTILVAWGMELEDWTKWTFAPQREIVLQSNKCE